MKNILLTLLLLGSVSCMDAWAVTAPEPISEESKRGLGSLFLGGGDDLSATQVFRTDDTSPYPVHFPFGVGVRVTCAAAGWVCLWQGSAADFDSIDGTRGTIVDNAGTPAFGVCEWIDTKTMFLIERGALKPGTPGYRSGVCRDANNFPFGRGCRLTSDCTTGDLNNSNTCDLTAGSAQKVTGAGLAGTQICRWSIEK